MSLSTFDRLDHLISRVVEAFRRRTLRNTAPLVVRLRRMYHDGIDRTFAADAPGLPDGRAQLTSTVVRQSQPTRREGERSRMTIDPSPACAHLAEIRDIAPRTPHGCEECLEIGDRWIHLRLCLTCGHVGCCDSSPNKHARKHYHATGHPIVRSFERGEDWRWCYPDRLLV